MSHFDLPSAFALLGKTVRVELVWDEDDLPLHTTTRIVGLVIAVEGLYKHPHFLTVDLDNPSRYPQEMFWADIRSLEVLED